MNCNVAALRNVWETFLEMRHNSEERKSKPVSIKENSGIVLFLLPLCSCFPLLVYLLHFHLLLKPIASLWRWKEGRKGECLRRERSLITAYYQQSLLTFELRLALVKVLIWDLEGSLEGKQAKADKEIVKQFNGECVRNGWLSKSSMFTSFLNDLSTQVIDGKLM